MTQPRIGILLDYSAAGSFSSRPHYALRCGYFDAIWRAGGLPVAIPYIAEAAEDYLDHCDGLILPGGFYPFPAALYGEETPDEEDIHPRYRFEAEITRRALDRDMPVLGICAGMQVMAAAAGATLYRDVRAELPTGIDHLNERPAEEPAHSVAIEADTQLRRVLGVDHLDVNTAHKEALKIEPEGLIVNARAPDGVIEGIEIPGRRFCIGVQWHPEFFGIEGNPNFNLFTGLIKAAKSGGAA